MLKVKVLIAAIGVASAASVATAAPVVTSHGSEAWQVLGTKANLDGVSWTTDGGATWTQDATLYVGQTVQFKFDMYKPTTGTHRSDHLEAWIDWDQSGTLEDGAETVAYGEVMIYNDPVAYGAAPAPADLVNLAGTSYSYTSDSFSLTWDMAGDYWLKALVTCSESLVSTYNGSNKLIGDPETVWDSQWDAGVDYQALLRSDLTYLWQGESEIYKFTVVSEPAAFALFGLGLVSLVAARKRAQKA